MAGSSSKNRLTEPRLISFSEAAEILKLHPSSIRQRKAGTEGLTHVRGLGRRVHLIESEVLALRQRVVDESLARDRRLKSLLGLANHK